MKHFKTYAIVWVLLVGLFNICCFVTPDEVNGVNKFEGAFWPAYGFVMLAFVLHMIFAYNVFSEKNEEKRRQNTMLTTISFVELVLMIVVGAICMLIPSMSYWVAIIVCYAVLALSIIFLLSTKTVEENKFSANSILNTKTAYMRELTNNAHELISIVKTEESKAEITKVYEAIRYSDTVSSDKLKDEEIAISNGLTSLKELLKDGSDEKAISQKADEIVMLVEKRNNKAKEFKRRR